MQVKGFRLDLVREKDLNGLNSSCLDSQHISYKDQRGSPNNYTWFKPIQSSQPIHGLFSFDSKFRSNDSITSEQFFCLPPQPRLVDLMVTIKTYRPNISPISGQLQPFGYQNNHQLNSRNVRLALRHSFQPFYTVPLQDPTSTGSQNQDLFYRVIVNGFREDGTEVDLAVFSFFVPLDKDPPPPPPPDNRPLPNNVNSNRPRVEIPDNSMECASVYSIPITPIQDQFRSSSTPTTASSSTTNSSLDPNAPLPRIPKRLKTGDSTEESSTKNNGKGKEVEKGIGSGQETAKAGGNGTKVKDGKKPIGKGSGKTLREASKKKSSTISPIKPPTPSSSSKPILTPSWTDPNGIEFFAPANNKSTVKPPPQVKVQIQNQIEASKAKRINFNPSPIDTLASSKSKLRSESPLTPSTSTSTATPNNWNGLSRQPQPNASSSATPISTQSHSRVETFQPMDLDDASSKSGFSSSDSTSPTEHLSTVDEEMQVEEEEEEEVMIRPNLNAETNSSKQLQSSIKGKIRRDSISRYSEKRDKESLGGGGRRRTRSRSPPPISSSRTNPNPNFGRRSVRDEETGGYRWESIPPDDVRSSSSSFSKRPVRFFGDHKENSESLEREQESLNNIKRREEECSNHISKREEESRERIRIREMEFKERLERKEGELEESLKRKKEELERDFKRMEEEYERERKRKEEEFGIKLKRKEENLVERLKKMEVSSRDEIKRKEEESLAQIKRQEEESQAQIKRKEEESQVQIKSKDEDSEARIRKQEEISNSAILKKMEEVNSELEKKKAASLEKETTLQKKEEEVRLKLEKMELEDASRKREQSNSVSLEQSRNQLQEQIKSLQTEVEKKRQQMEVDMERTKMIMEEEYKKREDFFVGDLQKYQDGIDELRNNKMVYEQEFNKRIEAADRFQADHTKELEKKRFKLNHDYQTALQIKETLLNECNQVRTELEFMNASLFTLRGQCAINLDNRNKLNEEVKMLESMKGNLLKGSSSSSSNSHQSSPSSKLWELHPRQYEFSKNQSQNMNQIGHQQTPQQQQFNPSQQQAHQQQLSALYQQSISHQLGNQQQNQQQISAELRERHQREQQVENQQFLQNQQRQQNSALPAQNLQLVRSMKSRKNSSMSYQPTIVGSASKSPNDSYASLAENPRRIQMTEWHPAQVGNQKQRSTTHPNPSQENAMQGQAGGLSNSTRVRQSSSSQIQPSNQGYYDHTIPDMQAWQQYLADVRFTRSSIDPTTGQMRRHRAPIQRSVSNQSSPSGGNQSTPLHHPSTLAAQAQENRKRKRFSTGEPQNGEQQASEQALLDFQNWQSRESGNNGSNGSSSTIPMPTSAVDPNNNSNNQATASESWKRSSGQRSSSDTIVSQQNQSNSSNHSRVGSGGTVGVQNHGLKQNQSQNQNQSYASLRSASLNQALPNGSRSNSGSVPPPPTRANSIPRVAFPPAKSNLPSRLSEGPFSASLVPSASSRWDDSQFRQAQSPISLNPPQPQQSISDQNPALHHTQDQPQQSESQAPLVESNPEAPPAQFGNLPNQPADETMVKSEEADETEVGKDNVNEKSQESNGKQEEEEEEVLTPPPRESSFQLPQMPTNDSSASQRQDEASAPIIKSEEERDELDSDSDSDHELA